MKLTVKTLKGSHFEINVNPTETVMAVKKHIEDAQGKDNLPWGQQLLIHNGKVLKDEMTLKENMVSENGFIVVMLSKSKASSSAATSSAQPASIISPAAAPASISTVAREPDLTSASGAEITNVQTNTYDQAASNLVSGSNLEQTIKQLIDMGGGRWDKETVSRALNAAYNNPERAVDYLYSGIPETTQVVTSLAQLAAQEPDSTTPSTLSGEPNASPLNMFPEGALAGAISTDGSSGFLDFLRSNQHFQTLRSMVQTNPHILQPMLQELGKQNPQLLRLIQEHQAEFLQLISEPLEDSDGDVPDQPDLHLPHAINVTPAEQEAIERLEAMGFDKSLVIEAYLACDRNEELAANYLLENAGDFEE